MNALGGWGPTAAAVRRGVEDGDSLAGEGGRETPRFR